MQTSDWKVFIYIELRRTLRLLSTRMWSKEAVRVLFSP